jgi:hypothetical protein
LDAVHVSACRAKHQTDGDQSGSASAANAPTDASTPSDRLADIATPPATSAQPPRHADNVKINAGDHKAAAAHPLPCAEAVAGVLIFFGENFLYDFKSAACGRPLRGRPQPRATFTGLTGAVVTTHASQRADAVSLRLMSLQRLEARPPRALTVTSLRPMGNSVGLSSNLAVGSGAGAVTP